ncbi:MAG: TPM domain-containing protein [Firmicutes bacterium]|nr:TPM domain-containing protein [Bacillota bacterium]
MFKGMRIIVIALLLVAIGSVSGYADFPSPRGFVNDFAGVIDTSSANDINELASALKDEQGIELAVVTIESSEPFVPKDYATTLFNEWGIGGPEDSGLLMLLALKEREVQVEVGYGLEGVLPDGKVGGILDQVALPHFGRGDYGKGFLEAALAFRSELAGEHYTAAKEEDEFRASLISFLILAAIIYFLYHRGPRRPVGPGGTISRTGPMYPGTIRSSRPSGGRGGGLGGGRGGGFGGGRSGGGGAGRKF